MSKIIQFPTTVENIQRLMLNNPNDGFLSKDGLFPINKNKTTFENPFLAKKPLKLNLINKDNWKV